MKIRLYNGYRQFYDTKLKRWVFTHRRVAAKKVGGPIGRGREVHHINGQKTDNRASNLRVMSSVDHRKLHAKRRRTKK
jgi:hypothetical protein